MANKKTAPKNERAGANAKAKKTKAKKRVKALAKPSNQQKMALTAYKREKKALKKTSSGAKPPKTVLQKRRAVEAEGMARQHYGNDVAKPAMKKTAQKAVSTVGKVTNTSKASNARTSEERLRSIASATKTQNNLAKEALKKKVY